MLPKAPTPPSPLPLERSFSPWVQIPPLSQPPFSSVLSANVQGVFLKGICSSLLSWRWKGRVARCVLGPRA